MPSLILATGNPKKVEEFETLLEDFRSWGEVAGPTARLPEESDSTYMGNALIKARYVAQTLDKPALADDSGLEVYSLGRRPGVHSARYAPGTDEDRVEKLLWELSQRKGAPDRAARYVCALALVVPRQGELVVQMDCEGGIITQPVGKGGFGYDTVFVPGLTSQTMAEMDPVTKSRISHRGKAVRAILPSLHTILAKF